MELINLPSEIQIQILNNLSSKEIVKLLKVSSSMMKLTKEISFGLKLDFNNTKIIDDTLKYLRGVHTIDLSCCDQITDAGFRTSCRRAYN